MVFSKTNIVLFAMILILASLLEIIIFYQLFTSLQFQTCTAIIFISTLVGLILSGIKGFILYKNQAFKDSFVRGTAENSIDDDIEFHLSGETSTLFYSIVLIIVPGILSDMIGMILLSPFFSKIFTKKMTLSISNELAESGEAG